MKSIRRITLLVIWDLLFYLAATCAYGQVSTTYPLPTTSVDYINYGGKYANLLTNQIPVTINGVPYEVGITMHTDSAGNCNADCNIGFTNLDTGEKESFTYAGSLVPLQGPQPPTASGTFSNGSFMLYLKPTACSRYGCRWVQTGSTLTLNGPQAALHYPCGKERGDCLKPRHS